MNEPLLTAKQLAARLNVSESWAYQYQGPGRVHVGRAIRFDPELVERYRLTGEGAPAPALRTIGPSHRWRIMAPTGFNHGGVYFIQGEDGGPIKIGWSQYDIGRRFEEHQEGSPSRLVILATLRGASLGTEAQLHRRFGHLRLHGEWFAPGDALIAYVETLRQAAA